MRKIIQSFSALLLFSSSLALATNQDSTFIQGPTLIESNASVSTSGGTTTLTVDSDTNTNFTGTQSQIALLPDATTLKIGRRFSINNTSTGSITVKDGAAASLAVIPAGGRASFLAQSTASAGGAWTVEGKFTLNGITGISQTLAVGSSGSDFGISSSGSTHTFNLPTADASHTGKLSSTDWSTFNGKQSALSFGNLSDVGTDGITVTGGSGVVIGSGTSISQQVSDSSHNGYLSSTDWSTFNGKQPAGDYITAITGDLSASGPGSVPGTLASSVNIRYVDFLDGNDSTGTGTPVRPWKTLQHACTAITGSVSINRPYTIFLSGGNNDTDTTTILCPPNITITSNTMIQVGQPLTITGGATNDGITLTNIIFVGAVTWIRNDFSVIGANLNNTEFFSGPVFKQNGSGQFGVAATNAVFVNADFKTGGLGSFFFNTTFLGTTTFEDADFNAYYEIMGGYSSSNISVSGGAELYLSGVQCDEAFGCALTGTTTGNGTPIFQSDSGSVPKSISGSFSFTPISHANHEGYTPTVSGNWSPAPTYVGEALDQLAARSSGGGRTVNSVSADFTIPALSSDYILNVNTSSGAVSVTLPSAVSSNSFCVDVKNIGSPASAVTVLPVLSQKIDGASSDSISDQYTSNHYCAVSGNWFIY